MISASGRIDLPKPVSLIGNSAAQRYSASVRDYEYDSEYCVISKYSDTRCPTKTVKEHSSSFTSNKKAAYQIRNIHFLKEPCILFSNPDTFRLTTKYASLPETRVVIKLFRRTRILRKSSPNMYQSARQSFVRTIFRLRPFGRQENRQTAKLKLGGCALGDSVVNIIQERNPRELYIYSLKVVDIQDILRELNLPTNLEILEVVDSPEMSAIICNADKMEACRPFLKKVSIELYSFNLSEAEMLNRTNASIELIINGRGLPVNLDAVEFVRKLTRLEVKNFGSMLIPYWLGRMSSLRALSIENGIVLPSEADYEIPPPDVIPRLHPNLRDLKLHCRISREVLNNLFLHSQYLVSVDLGMPSLSIWTELSHCKQLRRLTLRLKELDSDIFHLVGHLESLEILKIESPAYQFTHNDLTILRRISTLRSFSLNGVLPFDDGPLI